MILEIRIMLYIIITIGVCACAAGLIALIGTIQKKTGREGSSLGGCLTFVIIISAIILLLYLYDLFGGSYDLNMPIRRAF